MSRPADGRAGGVGHGGPDAGGGDTTPATLAGGATAPADPTTTPTTPATPATLAGAATAGGNPLLRWFFAPVPLGRVAALRTLAYLFVPLDVLVLTRWVLPHKDVPGALYQPLLVGRVLHLPTPTYWFVVALAVALVGCALVAATGRAPRLLGAAVFVLYFEWMIVAMSYGKVDHDRIGYLVLLAVLPTIGKARWGDTTTLSERAGWAMRVTQIAVVCTYFLASLAKLRFGGIGWLTGATLTRAVLRRGTVFSDWTLGVPGLLVASQWFIVAFELSSPVVLFLRKDRVRYAVVAFFYAFHAMVFGALTIAFWPHLVAMASFLPLERARPLRWLRHRLDRRATHAAGAPADAPAGSPVAT